MAVEPNGNAPYAAPKNVFDVIERFRHRGLRTPFTLDLMGQVGVPDGAAHRTIQALKLLDLIDDEGQPTDALEALKRASEEEYGSRLAEIVRSAYHNVFAVIDPVADSTSGIERVRLHADLTILGRLALELSRARDSSQLKGKSPVVWPRACVQG